MVDPRGEPQRSVAAQAASRRNGAKSKGPKSRAGKSRSARNAFKHGFRAKRSLPPKLPDWLETIERELIMLSGQSGPGRHDHLDRVLLACFLINEIDDLIDASLSEQLPLSDEALEKKPCTRELLKLQDYRRRFRSQRDTGIRKLLGTGSWIARKAKRASAKIAKQARAK